MKRSTKILIGLLLFVVACLVFGKDLFLFIGITASLSPLLVLLLPAVWLKNRIKNNKINWLTYALGIRHVAANLFALFMVSNEHILLSGFIAAFVLISAILSIIYLLVCGITACLKKQAYYKQIIVFIAVDLLALCLTFYQFDIQQEYKEENFNQGSKLDKYIEGYKKQNGFYPANLKDLPKEAQLIHPTKVVKEFYYSKMRLR